VEKGPADGGRYHRDPDYRREKAALTERLVGLVERILPGVRDHIEWKEAATPVTQERFTRSTGGTSYGIELSCDQIGPLRLGPETEIPGLYLCGASAPSGHGIAGVMRGGLIAAGAVLETDLLRLVRSGEVFGDREQLPPLRDDWDPWRDSH
jgi:phytoene dehydrogenase-like protein